MIKTFRKFNITIDPCVHTNVNLLEMITEIRLRKEYKYNKTPYIFINPITKINPYNTKYDYEENACNIEHTIKHSFTPYKISYYREVDVLQVGDKLVTRIWMNCEKDILKFLVLMEKISKDTNYFEWKMEYSMIINNPYWYPSNYEILKQDIITQTIISKDEFELK